MTEKTMGRPRKLTHSMPTDLKDLVTVAYVEDMELAERYRFMLLESSIPVVIQKSQSSGSPKFSDIALQVPEEFIDQAYNLLTQQAVCDDFFSMAFGSEENLPSSGGIVETDEEE
jgi:hypothetical protein